MHIFKHKKLKRALITFPKVAGTTVQHLLTPNFELEPHIHQHKNLVGWKTVRLTETPDNFFDLEEAKHNIPEDYTVTVLYRNPIERYISGVKTLLRSGAAGLIRYEDNPDDNFWAQKKTDWYKDYILELFATSGLNYDFDNVHTMRVMLYVFILGVEFNNVEFVEVNEFDSWLRDTHQLPDSYEVPRENKEQGMFSVRINQVLKKEFQEDSSGIGNYIKPDMKMYEHLQQYKCVQPTFLNDLKLVHYIFQEAYPAGTNPLTQIYPQPRWYMHAMMEWLEHSTAVPPKTRDQINTHIIQVIDRYISITKNGDLNVRVQMQNSEGD